MTWSTMMFPAIKELVNGYPYPYVQKYDGSIQQLDKPYDNKSLPADTTATDTTSAIVVTRTLTFDTVMKVIQAFEQIHNLANSPVLFLYGSNDNITWKEIGHSQRMHASYLPGHPYRFFRLAVYMKMHPSERYSSVILDIVEKYQKL